MPHAPAAHDFCELLFRGTPSKGLYIRDGIYVFALAELATYYECMRNRFWGFESIVDACELCGNNWFSTPNARHSTIVLPQLWSASVNRPSAATVPFDYLSNVVAG